ncbi:Beta-lactamase superfamily domain protein [uncultured archaeon]|nr:Beta-lactamase superfamily domain protein [uncultured archaeon]
MKVTKIGHCCMLIEENDLRILTDPGLFTTKQNKLRNIDVVVITHNDIDHLSMESLKKILENNPASEVITNKSTGENLKKEKIHFTRVEEGGKYREKGVTIEGFGKKHATMHELFPEKENTGYLIANRLFYPGDAFTIPENRKVEILALPVAAPWLKISESIDYAMEIKPKICFPIHDSIMAKPGMFNGMFGTALGKRGIEFMPIENGKEMKF